MTKKIIPILFSLLIIVSCKKDTIIKIECDTPKTIIQEIEPCNMPDSVHYIPLCTSPFGITFINHLPIMGAPRFNLNNSNEITFYKTYSSQAFLVKFLLNTKVTYTLTNMVNNINAQPYWSTDGFIYYNGDDQYVHKIDPNTNVITNVNLLFGTGNPIVDYGFIYSYGGTFNWPNIYYKNNSLGQHIDSVYSGPYNAADLNNQGILAFTDTFSTGWDISLLSYTNNTKNVTRLTNFMDISANTYITDIKWHPNNQDVYFVKKYKELFKINIVTKKLTLVKRTFDLDSFDSFTISPDGSKIVVAHTIYNIDYSQAVPSPCKLVTSNYFTMMDLNGCNEQLLYKE